MRIVTPSLVLRPFVVEDAERILTLSNEESARRWLPSQVYADVAQASGVLEFLISQYETPADPKRGYFVLAIDDRASGTLIGHVGFSPLEDEVEVGFGIAEDFQRRGFATEAVDAASRWVMDSFDLRRILGITSAANIASQRTLLKAGFSHERDKVMSFQGTEQPVRVYVLSRAMSSGSRET